MKIQQSNKNGSTLIIAMAAIAFVAVLVSVAFTSTGQNGRIGIRGQGLSRALNAADGAFEYAFASWKETIRTNGLRAPTNSQITIAAPTTALHSGFATSGVTFSNFSVVNANQWGETTDSGGATITDPINAKLATVPGHPGWAGVASFYRAQVSASVPSRGGWINVNVARSFQITGVPLFQAAIFFEHDIEMHPGSQMIINGLVHSNNDLWLATGGANNLKFMQNVSYVGQIHEAYKPLTTYGSGSTPPASPNPPIWQGLRI